MGDAAARRSAAEQEELAGRRERLFGEDAAALCGEGAERRQVVAGVHHDLGGEQRARHRIVEGDELDDRVARVGQREIEELGERDALSESDVVDERQEDRQIRPAAFGQGAALGAAPAACR